MSTLQMISLALSVGVIAWIVYYCRDWKKIGKENGLIKTEQDGQ